MREFFGGKGRIFIPVTYTIKYEMHWDTIVWSLFLRTPFHLLHHKIGGNNSAVAVKKALKAYSFSKQLSLEKEGWLVANFLLQ